MPQVVVRMTGAIALLFIALTSIVSAASVNEEALVDRVLAVTGASSDWSSNDPRTAGGVKCGTPLLLEIKLAWPDLSPEARKTIAASIQLDRPELDESYDRDVVTSSGTYGFRLHFSRTGSDSVDMTDGTGEGGIPVYVLQCADLLETVITVEVDELGFRYPVSDQVGDETQDPRFDIYFQDLGTQYYGITNPDVVIKVDTSDSFWATSFMVLQSRFRKLPTYENRPYEAMAVTLAHEFNHSIQWTYDVGEGEIRKGSSQPWFLEASATAMEEFVFDDINDYYAYLPAYYFGLPWKSLRTFRDDPQPIAGELHSYASCMFFIFLAERYNPSILREIWEECGRISEFNTFEAIRSVLQVHGSSFEDQWAEFWIWNYFTGPRAADWSYDEADQYAGFPNDVLPHFDTYPLLERSNEFPTDDLYPVDEFGVQYLRFQSPLSDTSITFRLRFTPLNSHDEWMIVTAGLRGSTKPVINYTQDVFNPVEVPNWQSFDELLMVIAPIKEHVLEQSIVRELAYSFEVADSFVVTDSKSAILKVFPNPFQLSGSAEDKFSIQVDRAEAVETSMSIYTLDGRLVVDGMDRDEMNAPAAANAVFLNWDGTNSNDRSVASGIYLALVKIGSRHEVVKVAIRNEMK